MTASLKKLLLISATLLLGVMSAGVADAQTTTYTFSESFDSVASIQGQVLVNSDFTINGYSGVTSSLGAVTGVVNIPGATDVYYVKQPGNFKTGNYYFGFNFSGGGTAYSVLVGSGCCDGGELFLGPDLKGSSLSFSQVSSVTLGGAPEIDGSLAPKVGFLLGCLFLMFGRKKQNSEPMMTA